MNILEEFSPSHVSLPLQPSIEPLKSLDKDYLDTFMHIGKISLYKITLKLSNGIRILPVLT